MKGKFSLSVMPSKSQTAQKHGYSAMPSGCSVWICRFLFLLLSFSKSSKARLNMPYRWPQFLQRSEIPLNEYSEYSFP